jgi:Kyakuja-Dileera-Zisupton transposase
VDEWSKEILDKWNILNDDDKESPCAECWRSMKTELTTRMWGIFEETGLFLALCCHGFVLLLADMVCSGEL